MNEQQKQLFFELTSGIKFNPKKHQHVINIFKEGKTSEVGTIIRNKEISTTTEIDIKPVDDLDFLNGSKTTTKESQEEEQVDQNEFSSDEEYEEEEDEIEDPKQIRIDNNIIINGSDVPNPVNSFSSLKKRFKIPEYLMKNISALGYVEPTPVQKQAIPIMLSRREAVVVAPTGSGKTAAFAIPILTLLKEPKQVGFRALILSPTAVLASQLHRDFLVFGKGKDWAIECLHTKNTNYKNTKNDVLISTPKQLTKLIKNNEIDLSKIEFLILDEGDQLFNMGFIHDIDEIITACNNKNIARYLFSATMPLGVEHMASTFLKIDHIKMYVGVRNTTAATIDQELIFCGNEKGKIIALRDIFRKGIKPPILIFVQTVKRAEELYKELRFDKSMHVDYIHAKRPTVEVKQVIRDFRLGKIFVLICTDVMSRGLDFKGVGCVINFDFPHDILGYIHRIGRTGRAGRKGKAFTFFTTSDMKMLRNLADIMKKSGCKIENWMLGLEKRSEKEMEHIKYHPPKRESITHDDEEVKNKKIKKGKKRKKRNMKGNEQKRKKVKIEK